MDSTAPLVVHLVHGTWPYGPFDFLKGKGTVWFEEGSEFRQRIEELAGVRINFRVFHWSGKNTLNARCEASRGLTVHLESAFSERPDTKHIVIAHSHGGNVAADCIGRKSNGLPGTPRVKALICMATPFLMFEDVPDFKLSTFGLAVSLLIASSCIIIADHCSIWFRDLNFGTVVFLILSVIVMVFTTKAWSKPFDGNIFISARSVHQDIRIFVFRALRDEAALVIGLSQAIDLLTGWLFRATVGGKSEKKLVSWVIGALLSTGTFVLGIVIELSLSSQSRVTTVHHLVLSVAIMVLIMASMASLSFAVLALSVGLWDFRAWPRITLDVDAAPPAHPCVYESISDFSVWDKDPSTWDMAIPAEGILKHGLYAYHQTQTGIAEILREVARPEYRNVRRNAGKRTWGYESQRIWGELDPGEVAILMVGGKQFLVDSLSPEAVLHKYNSDNPFKIT